MEFERAMVRIFKECLPDCFQVQRMLQVRGGKGLPDVEIRLNNDPLVHAECKHGKKPNIRKALEQARHDAHKGAIPAAVTKIDGGETVVSMLIDDFLRLLRGLDTDA